MTEAILTYRGTVYPWHCDHVGHMNVMWYVGKFDEATWHLFREMGLTRSFLQGAHRGMAAVEQTINYIAELHAGDTVTIRSHVVEVREKSLRFVHEMFNDETGGIAARTVLKGVHLDTDARKSCALPAHVIERARAMLIAEAAA